jgi:succinate dehydrogenase / fumarate reductase membrane anchor subunit
LISLAVIHGFNGLREILYEYLSAGGRVVAGTLTWSLTFLFIGAGGYSILMFQADEKYIEKHPTKIEKPVEPTSRRLELDPDANLVVRC